MLMTRMAVEPVQEMHAFIIREACYVTGQFNGGKQTSIQYSV